MKQIFRLTFFSLIQHISIGSRELELKLNNFLKWKIPSRPNIEVSRCFCVSYGFANELDILCLLKQQNNCMHYCIVCLITCLHLPQG